MSYIADEIDREYKLKQRHRKRQPCKVIECKSCKCAPICEDVEESDENKNRL